MKLNNIEARKVVRVNNLLWKCTFYDELVTLPCYDLCFVLNTDVRFMNCAMNFELDDIEEFKSELKYIENYFKKRRKKSSIYLTIHDTPEGIQEVLMKKGYKEIPEEEGVFWGVDKESFVDVGIKVDGLKIKECRTKEDFAQYLIAAKEGYNDFDYTPYASSLSKLFNNTIDGVTQLHFVGMIDGKPVASGTIGICFDMAIWINAAVIPEYRKRGINTAMMIKAIKTAQKIGANKFFYNTDADNIGSIMSGKKLGFTEVIRQKMWGKEGGNYE